MTDKEESWVPMAKRAVELLPKTTNYSDLDALYCLQLDHNNGNAVTINGYVKLWKWTRKKVRIFIPRQNLRIVYPKDTAKNKNQKGFLVPIKKGPLKGHKQGHKLFIDFNNLKGPKGHKGAIKGATTKEKEKENTNLMSFESQKDGVPHEQILDLYHTILPELASVKKWTKKREVMLKARWREDTKRQNLAWWKGYFEFVRESEFLMGKNGKWQANLEFLIRSSKLTNTIEGIYHRQGN